LLPPDCRAEGEHQPAGDQRRAADRRRVREERRAGEMAHGEIDREQDRAKGDDHHRLRLETKRRLIGGERDKRRRVGERDQRQGPEQGLIA